MKKHLLLGLSTLLIATCADAQTKAVKASLDAEGQLQYETITIDREYVSKATEGESLTGFPFGRPANGIFKTTRGATLVDLDGDGNQEILFGADSLLWALDGDGSIIWEKVTAGICILPPTVDDMNGDGEWDIAVNNAAFAAFGYEGKTYLLNEDGTDKPGWPVSFNNNWMINAPVMADVNGDGTMEIVTGERVGGTQGFLHVLDMSGSELEGWPVETSATIAFTPSVGDINNDGSQNVVAGISTNAALYAYTAEGDILDGFPQIPESASLSYQSPLLADITGDGNLEIIGSRHGDNPEYYAVDATGAYAEGWPVASAGWTYAPPSMADLDGDNEYEIFMGNPNIDGSENPQPLDVIFGFDTEGENLDNFPLSKLGGNEGVITIADIDNNGVVDILFTSNVFTLGDGQGFLHAYATDGSGELEGFPLRTPALSYLNSGILGDIDGDGNLDVTTVSSSSTFGQGVDSVYVSAFNLEVPYLPENIFFNAYKGSNGRTGLMSQLSLDVNNNEMRTLSVYPNPAHDQVTVELPEGITDETLTLYDLQGRQILQRTIGQSSGKVTVIDTQSLPSGVYFVHIPLNEVVYMGKLIVE
ncbi:MAG: T9SS type A sorting domain-containing protein [Cryomorphaceae bacterium]